MKQLNCFILQLFHFQLFHFFHLFFICFICFSFSTVSHTSTVSFRGLSYFYFVLPDVLNDFNQSKSLTPVQSYCNSGILLQTCFYTCFIVYINQCSILVKSYCNNLRILGLSMFNVQCSMFNLNVQRSMFSII